MLAARQFPAVRLCSAVVVAAFCQTIGIGAVAAAPAARAYNAVADFSAAHNPNGTWSYRAGSALLAHVQPACNTIGMACRWNGQPICNSVEIAATKGRRPRSWLTIRIPADHLLMDPEALPYAAVRWTAPVAGSFEIRGDFLGIDVTGNNHPVSIVSKGNTLFSGTIPAFGARAPFDVTQTFARGQFVEFRVATGATCYYLSTGLRATITSP